ncbi:hypothetical protein [Clostridium tagluense]|uniref:hypothetical protein n=1 Tax=Clostridium tagluense TaxID=360422 RepID=UPI001CF3BE16|nr:hypothetical protein [Clostridium tagluense]MCB2299864.1 hypothetical protein [Clostridium tagluense]
MNHLKSNTLASQILEYIDDSLKYDTKITDNPIEITWRIKVLIIKIDGTKIIPQEKVIQVKTKLVDIKERNYKINGVKIQ